MITRLVRNDEPAVFAPLLQPGLRYYGAYGGRGSAKSWFFAKQLAIRAASVPTRWVCIREVQNSLRDSCYQLLKDRIQSLGLGSRFNILDNEIRGVNGSLIIFRGMASYNAETIKSLEAYDGGWIEEAQTLSRKSLQLLRPTLRKEGSQLWASWNPRNRTDPIDELFRKCPPKRAVSVMANWRDNPWFPDVLDEERRHDLATLDPEEYAHIWEGTYGVAQGSILGKQVARAEREGRIHDDVDYDPDGPGIEISSDLGFRDTAAWWFWQRRAGGAAILDYMEDSGLDADDWIILLGNRLTARGWELGRIWLPHDARTRTFASKHSAMQKFLKAFGNKVSIVPRTKTLDRISAARTMVGRCEFHETNCAHGLDGLRAWEYEFNFERMAFSREPVHNWASHPSDAFSYGAQVIGDLTPAPEAEVVRIGARHNMDTTLTGVTLEDLWAEDELERAKWRNYV